MEKLIVSPSPHQRGNSSTTKIMTLVIIALIPSIIAATVIFGLRALILVLTCVASSVLFEFFCRKIMKRDNTITDFSAAVTGIILALNLPVTLPLWMAVLGCFVAIVITKQLFGAEFGYSVAIGRVFAVNNREINPVIFLYFGQHVSNGFAANIAANIANT